MKIFPIHTAHNVNILIFLKKRKKREKGEKIMKLTYMKIRVIKGEKKKGGGDKTLQRESCLIRLLVCPAQTPLDASASVCKCVLTAARSTLYR